WLERVGDVAADQDVGAEGARVLRRKGPHHTTVDDRRGPEVDGGEDARERHAGADRVGQEAVIQYHRPAGLEVGGDGGERNGQRAEVPDRVRRPGEAGEELGHALSRDDPPRARYPGSLNRRRAQGVARRELSIDREIAPAPPTG